MPLPVPTLDDRRFDDLVAEARALIPSGAPEWTNHNPSDPGITLVELLAYLAETLIYRLDRTTPETTGAFLDLLDATRRSRREELRDQDLATQTRSTIHELRTPDRAITCGDFEMLARRAKLDAPHGAVSRVHCIARRNLEPGQDPELEQIDHMSVIVVSASADDNDAAAVRAKIFDYLEERRLLGTRLHVVGPIYLHVDVTIDVIARRDQASTSVVEERVVRAVSDFLNPRTGGSDGRGWPFGRAVFVSELYALVRRLDGIDDVTNVALTAASGRKVLRDAKKADAPLVGLELKPHELVDAKVVCSAKGQTS